MQVCTSLQTDNHASTPPLSFLQAGCPSCRPTNSVKALKAKHNRTNKCLHQHVKESQQCRATWNTQTAILSTHLSAYQSNNDNRTIALWSPLYAA